MKFSHIYEISSKNYNGKNGLTKHIKFDRPEMHITTRLNFLMEFCRVNLLITEIIFIKFHQKDLTIYSLKRESPLFN